ncbi:MAG: multicopper oxidase family protein [Acidobacteriota bacterium]|jgi:FtsP/CotA-like multicopper oxidase with cupredoxin domain|nr:multicopper oxidase domain-containing protein [Bryobacteraceae bacterium CoA2 C42]MCA2965162.1 multicopper oxidase domain-containing protein [Acidobacteriaceae bacterium]
MPVDRRGFFGRLFASAAAPAVAASPSAVPVPVQTPDLPKLPYKLIDGVKEFTLIAEVIRTSICPGRILDAWGFNGSIPGPLIEANEGDRLRIIVENQLPEMTGIHWHGLEIPMEVDGSVGLGMDPIPPGARHVYEFTARQNGTFFYHSHFPMQEMMGLIGMFVLHPAQAHTPRVDRDFGFVLQEWDLKPNNPVPNSLAMEFNWLTLNGKAGPDTTPMIVRQGERIRIRIVNMGMDHHPIHLHGNQFFMTGTEAGRRPEATWYAENTIIVGVAQARDIEFDAKHLGDWMLHCHLPHHMMNQMVPMVGPAMHHPVHSKVPGYPQDMWMPDDEIYNDKPENFGLRKGWSGAMMGMMTMVRVVTPQRYAEIEALRKNPPKTTLPKGEAHHHHHGEGK